MKKILNNKKGFTLVEIIVVLVILAILAGAAIPTMLGFIDDAREKTVVAEGRAVLVSAQVQATEIEAGVLTDFDEAAIKTLAGVEGDVEVDSIDTDDTTGRVTGFTYENDSYKVVFAAGKYTVTDAE